MAAAVAKVQYSAIVLVRRGTWAGRIGQLLIKNPLCKKMVVVTRRKTDAFAATQGLRGGCQPEGLRHQKGYGLGKVVESWYSTGIPPTTPK